MFLLLPSALLMTHLQDTKSAPDTADAAKEALHSETTGHTSNGHTIVIVAISPLDLPKMVNHKFPTT